MASSRKNPHGYRCPVQGCDQKKNRAFNSPMCVAMHIVSKHGDEELVKRLRIKES